MTPTTTAGTAADGYRATPAVCPWRPAPTDPHERPRCEGCGREQHWHLIPTPSQRTEGRP